jgi:microcompartment protein CcmK/EutM
MQLARVIGDVVASQKDGKLVGLKLLVVQPIGADGKDVGKSLVATDSVGAGVGEHVFFVRGREASFPFHPVEPPTDAAIVGIIDHWFYDAPPAAPEGGSKVEAAEGPRGTGPRGTGKQPGRPRG